MTVFTDFADSNTSGLEFTDISSEEFRTYIYPNNVQVTLPQPVALNISDRGGHRVYTEDGISHYIVPGWVHLAWKSKDGCSPFAF